MTDSPTPEAFAAYTRKTAQSCVGVSMADTLQKRLGKPDSATLAVSITAEEARTIIRLLESSA